MITTITFKQFEKALNEMKDVYQFQSDIDDVTRKYRKYDASFVYPDLSSTIIDLLSTVTGDDGEWISYFVYELYFGEKYNDGSITDADGKQIKLKTIEDLWNLLNGEPTIVNNKEDDDEFITEVNGDLFDSDDCCYLAHCISGDFALGAGIAKEFDSRYNMRQSLHIMYPIPTGMSYGYVGSALLINNVFNLVTKKRYWDKPTYEILQTTLEDMRDQCIELGIEHIAMPKIGCGLDKLAWDSVKSILKTVFEGTGIKITVYVK